MGGFFKPEFHENEWHTRVLALCLPLFLIIFVLSSLCLLLMCAGILGSSVSLISALRCSSVLLLLSALRNRL